VTVPVFQSIAAGLAACTVIANTVGASLELIDVGVNFPSGQVPLPRRHSKVLVSHGRCANGTEDISERAAMTAEQLEAAMEQGAASVRRASSAGCRVVCVGEIGIGNTTAAAALLAALTGWFPFSAASQPPPLVHS
jgi:nicotinate-nucleotide--dimethylbenzimidazole phosphoribosyltransferase